MGNLLACGVPVRVTSLGGMKPCEEEEEESFARLVLADGTIQELQPPVTVAELMLEHPLHFVCHVNQEERRFDRDHPLPADVTLESGEIYYLRSKAGFSSSKSPLSKLKRSCSDSGTLNSASDACNKSGLFFKMKQKGGVTQVTISPEFIAQLLGSGSEEEEEKERRKGGEERSTGNVFEDDHGNAELQMAYQMRLVSRSVSWRPKLATIQESSG